MSGPVKLSGPSRGVRRRRYWTAFALAIAAPILAVYALRTAGRLLMVQDALQPARGIVVLGGQMPFRSMEAAAIYRQGWAPEVWLTQGAFSEEDVALKNLRIDRTPEYEYSRRVLERLNVPAAAIRVLPGNNQNTADEVRTIDRELEARGGGRVIIISSKYHTRRIRALWHLLARRDAQAIVRYTPDDPFDASRWWRNSDDANRVTHEWFGILNAWAGFPLKSLRD
jgi:uncharacterized SAM-binding protein YcdF (DUF218 family)